MDAFRRLCSRPVSRRQGGGPSCLLTVIRLLAVWPSRLLGLHRIRGPKGLRIAVVAFAVLLNATVFLAEAVCLGALGPAITWVLCPAARTVLNLPITVERCTVLPLGGYVRVEGLRIANPDAFVTADRRYAETPLLSLRHAEVDIAFLRLLLGELTIERFEVEGLRLFYAVESDDSNFGALLTQAGLTGTSSSDEAGTPAEAVSDEPRLLALRLADNRVTVRYPVMDVPTQLTVPLPPLDLTDPEGHGLFRELVAVVRGTVRTVSLTVGGLNAGGRAVLDGAEAVGNAAVGVGGTVLEGAGAVGAAAAEAGSAVLDGAGAAVKGFWSLFDRKDERAEPSSGQ